MALGGFHPSGRRRSRRRRSSPTATSRQEFSICFRARPVGGEPRPSDETSEAVWIERDRIADLDVHPSIRLRIEHGYARRAEPYYT